MKPLLLALALALLLTPFSALADQAQAAELIYTAFGYNTPSYASDVADEAIVTCEWSYDGDDASLTATGLAAGETYVTVHARYPALVGFDALYTAVVDEALNVTLGHERRPVYLRLSRTTDMPTRVCELFELCGSCYTTSNGFTREAPSELAGELMALIDEYDVTAWDGFSGSEPGVLDGEMFGLDALLSDGTTIHASGSNSFPDGYFSAAGAIERLFNGGAVFGEAPFDSEYEAAAGEYAYEGPGFGGAFTLTLNADGSYTFYEGMLSSYIGGGEWRTDGALITLTEQNGLELENIFAFTGDALVFSAEGSDNFLYVKVPDMGRFTRLGAAVDAYMGDDMKKHFDDSLTVGAEVPAEAIYDFYYTVDASTYPPHFQRYRFYVKDGAYRFYHETREGDHWPLYENDATVSGDYELTDEQWDEFINLISGGSVRRRPDDLGDGDSGPFMYLYWQGDPDDYQEYSFPNGVTPRVFVEFCEELKLVGS